MVAGRAALGALLLAIAAGVGGGGAGARQLTFDSSLLVSTGWLAARLHDPAVVLIQVAANDSAYQGGHIPGARLLRYGALVVDMNGISAELPPADSLRKVFESLGVSDSSHVVLTGTPLEVSRAFFTLDYLGLLRVSVLAGGITRWRAEHRPIASRGPAIVPGTFTPRPRSALLAQSSWLLAHLGKPGVSLVDMRRRDEYLGAPGSGSRGHIAGAQLLEWQEMFRDPGEFALRDRAELEREWRDRVTPGDTVVVYCRTGHRASSGYFVARLLGYPVKLYDGSYQEWSAKNLPLVSAPSR